MCVVLFKIIDYVDLEKNLSISKNWEFKGILTVHLGLLVKTVLNSTIRKNANINIITKDHCLPCMGNFDFLGYTISG